VRRWSAVCFDLVGTLCDFPLAAFHRLQSQLPEILDIRDDEFMELWPTTYRDLEIGAATSVAEAFESLVRHTGRPIDPDRLVIAAGRWRTFQERVLRPRADAAATLSRLRADGFKLGLIANQPVGVPALWKASTLSQWFDVAVFSCEVSIAKPDPRIYHMTCDRLRVSPTQCLFVGDGGSSELTGARAVGMHAIRIRVPHEEPELDRWLGREAWAGDTISRLADLRDFHSMAKS
jgi:putative hydrolase of the HAD superfamily